MSEYLPKYDMYIQYERLPGSVRAFLTYINGDPVAVVNADKTDVVKIKAIAHEIRHDARGDMGSGVVVREAEDSNPF